jgi:CRP/FNR family cyclic AMP-dependent transcriptional regulator
MARRTESTPASLWPALKTHLWFASCPEDFQQALIERSRLWHIKQGETLFSRGESHDSLCCVVAGALKLGSVNPVDGSQRLSLYVEPYHWFGEISVIDTLPRSQDAIADMDSTVLVVTGAQLLEWLQAHPAHWRDLARLACGKLRMVLTAMEDNATLTIEQQLARRLLFSATNFGQSTVPTVRKHVRLPQEYLARMLGVSRQTINKALRALERERVLALHYAEIEILDMMALVARAGTVDPGLRHAIIAADGA